MNPAILNYLRHHPIVPDITARTRISAIKLNTSTLEGGSLVCMLFLDGAQMPHYVLRIPRVPGNSEGIRANYAALQQLTQYKSLKDTVPIPACIGEVEGISFTLETCLTGTPLAIAMETADRQGDQHRLAGWIEGACHWLFAFHTVTPPSAPEPFLTTFPEVLARLEKESLLRLEETQTLADYLAPLREQAVPRSLCHGDFHPNNLLVAEDSSRPGVVDWERHQIHCPLYDLFTLLTQGYLFPPADVVDSHLRFRLLWQEETPVGNVFHKAFCRYTAVQSWPKSFDVRRAFAAYLAHAAVGILLTNDPRTPQRLTLMRRLLTEELS